MININWMIMPTAAMAILLYWAGKKDWLVNRIYRYRIVGIGLTMAAAAPALLLATYYYHWLDNAAWFYAFRSARFTELPAAGIGLSAGMITQVSGQYFCKRQMSALGAFLSVILALLCVLILIIPYVKPVLLPLSLPLQDRWSDGICIQTTPSTCGPASTATILRQYGWQVTEEQLAKECYSCGTGTENWYMARAMLRRGLIVNYLIAPRQSDELPYPAIAGTGAGGTGSGHFIAILGKDKAGQRYIVGDPVSGRLVLDKNALRRRYSFTGFFMVVRRA